MLKIFSETNLLLPFNFVFLIFFVMISGGSGSNCNDECHCNTGLSCQPGAAFESIHFGFLSFSVFPFLSKICVLVFFFIMSGAHKCYHDPRQKGEPCVAGHPCASGYSCHPGTQK